MHISKLANRFVKHPSDVVRVGDTVKVWVEKVDRDRKKISLTMVRGSKPPKQGYPLWRRAKSRVFCNFRRPNAPLRGNNVKTAPVLASSEPKRGLFRASTRW